MSILSKYYELINKIPCPSLGYNYNIDPDKPYTIVYNIDSRNTSQSTGLVRGVLGEEDTIVMIPLDAEDVAYATIINVNKIVKIRPYSFSAHFENFNNWIGVEVSEKGRIDLRVKYTEGESIVSVEEGSTYKIGYVQTINGIKSYTEGTGKIRSIIRSTTKEAMPEHINHFTNDIDYILVVDFGETLNSDTRSINVIDIRNIELVLPIDDGLTTAKENLKKYLVCLNQSIKEKSYYSKKSYDRYSEAYNNCTLAMLDDASTVTKICNLMTVLEDAVSELKPVEDSYDLVYYDKDTNTLYCYESLGQVVIEGCTCCKDADGCDCNGNKVIYYTNLGDKKELITQEDLNVYYYEGKNDIRGLKPYPNFHDVFDPSEHAIEDLIIRNHASIDHIYLACKYYEKEVCICKDRVDLSEEDGDIKSKQIVFKIENTTVHHFVFGGNGGKYRARNIRGSIIKCDIDKFDVGSILKDTDDKKVADENIMVSLIECNIDNLHNGGSNNNTFNSMIKARNSNIRLYYGTGVNRSISRFSSIILNESSTIKYACMIDYGSTQQTHAISLNNSNIEDIYMGAKMVEEDDNTGVMQGKFEFTYEDSNGEISDNHLILIINPGSKVSRIFKGYSDNELIDEKYIDIRQSHIIYNEYKE